MFLSVKVISILFTISTVHIVHGFPYNYDYYSYPAAGDDGNRALEVESLEGVMQDEDPEVVELRSKGATAVPEEALGDSSSGISLTNPENTGGVNAREDMPSAREGKQEGSRTFYPLYLASREIGQKIENTLRQIPARLDLQFSDTRLNRYPMEEFQPPFFGPFRLPPPPPPLPFPLPYPIFQDNPSQRPPPPRPLPHIPFGPPQLPIPRPPPPLSLPPPRPPIIDHRPPPTPSPTMGTPPPTIDTPLTTTKQPVETMTQPPPNNATNVWEILLPWWYPAHNRPPTTKPPPQIPPVKEPEITEKPDQIETTTKEPASEETSATESKLEETTTLVSLMGETNELASVETVEENKKDKITTTQNSNSLVTDTVTESNDQMTKSTMPTTMEVDSTTPKESATETPPVQEQMFQVTSEKIADSAKLDEQSDPIFTETTTQLSTTTDSIEPILTEIESKPTVVPEPVENNNHSMIVNVEKDNDMDKITAKSDTIPSFTENIKTDCPYSKENIILR